MKHREISNISSFCNLHIVIDNTPEYSDYECRNKALLILLLFMRFNIEELHPVESKFAAFDYTIKRIDQTTII